MTTDLANVRIQHTEPALVFFHQIIRQKFQHDARVPSSTMLLGRVNAPNAVGFCLRQVASLLAIDGWARYDGMLSDGLAGTENVIRLVRLRVHQDPAADPAVSSQSYRSYGPLALVVRFDVQVFGPHFRIQCPDVVDFMVPRGAEEEGGDGHGCRIVYLGVAGMVAGMVAGVVAGRAALESSAVWEV